MNMTLKIPEWIVLVRNVSNGRRFSPSPPTKLGDLSRLGNGERNLAKPKARQGRVSGKRTSHWAGERWLLEKPLSPALSPLVPRGARGKRVELRMLTNCFRNPD
jgi:hypothetical protein